MKRIVLALSIFVVCTLPVRAKADRADPMPIVPAHVGVVPMDGDRILSDQDLIICGNLIASIEPATKARLPRDGRNIDFSGKFLMLGLGEMHQHTQGPTDSPQYMKTPLTPYLANDVTTARVMLGYPNHLTIRKDIGVGELSGPSLFLAGTQR